MISLARLSWCAVAVAFGEVLLGSWTRINGAGMTCPDYPLCRGRIVPAFDGGVVWEWTHRFTALALSVLVIITIVRALNRRTASTPYVRGAAILAGALFLFQVFLGAATVKLSNTPISVVWHWGTAMALIASLAALAIFSGAGRSQRAGSNARAIAAVLAFAASVAFMTMCIGAYVSSSGAGLACVTIPGCAGNVVVFGNGQFVQMVHRFAAAISLLAAVTAFAFAWMQRASGQVRAWTTVALTLVFVQIVLGLLNVALRLPIDLREAHAANAALIFLAFAGATALAIVDASPAREPVQAV
ncbi:MAG TPA: COX15/CtaA family protein [Candidatus Rubrimentiphilum sp.]|nr:COX15/CtaA family protein [Candidatus Rubrimentiphilum sp.]